MDDSVSDVDLRRPYSLELLQCHVAQIARPPCVGDSSAQPQNVSDEYERARGMPARKPVRGYQLMHSIPKHAAVEELTKYPWCAVSSNQTDALLRVVFGPLLVNTS